MRFETNRINGETPILELKNISVKYGSIKALRDINLSINLGEIHAVVGEHGAGKSTLAQIVSNLIQPASGQVLLNGQSFTKPGYKCAMDAGIRMVFQKLQLNDALSVADNLFMTNNLFRSPFQGYNHKRVVKMAEKFLVENEFDLDPSILVSRLELSDRAFLSIIRNLYTPPSLLILDEALEKLSATGLEKVITSLKRLRSGGTSILFITHRIDDLYMIADRVSVIRKGEVLLSENVLQMDKISLIKMAYTQFTNLEKSTNQAEEFNKLLKYNEAVLKQLPIALIVSNHQNQIKLINEKAQAFFNLNDNSEISLEKLLVQNPQALQLVSDSLNNQDMQSRYNIPLLLDSGTVMVNIVVYPIMESSALIGNMLIVEDITEREQLREQLVLSEKLASIGLLAAGVAHEINNPLAVICNYLESLKQNNLEEHNREKVIEHLFDQIEYITQVISNLITFSENQNQITEKVEIVSNFNEIVTLVKFNGQQKNIEIKMAPEYEKMYININVNELKQVILNLFKNAFEAMPDGGDITITISEKEILGETKVLIVFADTGPGLGFENPSDVFLPFKSTKNTSTNFGLGLSLCYNILNRYDGDITVSSPSGGGCMFEIILPSAS